MSFFRKTVKDESEQLCWIKKSVWGPGTVKLQKHEKDDKSTIKIVFIFQIFWIHMIVCVMNKPKFKFHFNRLLKPDQWVELQSESFRKRITGCVQNCFFSEQVLLLNKTILFSINVCGMNVIWTYYICHVSLSCDLSSASIVLPSLPFTNPLLLPHGNVSFHTPFLPTI